MIDRKDNKVVWTSSAQAQISRQDAKGVKATVNEVVPKMFKKFPVKQN